ncbi:MAG: Crp/Fnr family transcriptional regulator [Rhodobacterales bacterium]|nr:Crp/Fnr family transcriptional regulator [Rhodobacterales bacterium]
MTQAPLDTEPDDSGPPTCFSCPNRERTEWCVLTEAETKFLVGRKKSRRYLPGETIYRQGDPCNGIYCVESDMVGIRRNDPDGNSILLGIAYEGTILGYRSYLADEEHRCSAEALKACTLCFIDAATLRQLLQGNPDLGLQFLKRTARALGQAEDKFFQSVTLTIRTRFAHLLLVMKDRYGQEHDDGGLVMELPLSRQDLASMIGVRPESMSRLIRRFEDEGIAFFSGRRVHVPRLHILMDEIQSADLA